uniref:Hypotheticial protein n=1 Tax=Schistosoma japonicum TaxID=6182 RepID=C1LEP9_SCHJA|nr:hypotheticial protein [Schistosoma japonicum]
MWLTIDTIKLYLIYRLTIFAKHKFLNVLLKLDYIRRNYHIYHNLLTIW